MIGIDCILIDGFCLIRVYILIRRFSWILSFFVRVFNLFVLLRLLLDLDSTFLLKNWNKKIFNYDLMERKINKDIFI